MSENCYKCRFFYCIGCPRQSVFSFIAPAVILQPELIWLEKLYQNPSPAEFFPDLNFEEKVIVFRPKWS